MPKKTTVTARTPSHSLAVHLSHCGKLTTVNPRQIKSTGLVGYARLLKPSPKQYAVTVTWRVKPTRSDSGSRMGMSRNALAEPEATKNSMTNARTYTISAAVTGLVWAKAREALFKRVSMMPPCATMCLTLAAMRMSGMLGAMPVMPSSAAFHTFRPPAPDIQPAPIPPIRNSRPTSGNENEAMAGTNGPATRAIKIRTRKRANQRIALPS